MARLEKTGCFRHASLFAQGSLKSGKLDILEVLELCEWLEVKEPVHEPVFF
jgi:hypothetical protein